MKKIIAWILKIEKGYREITFRFDDITDAEGFLQAWMYHKNSDDAYNKGTQDKFSLIPVMEEAAPDTTEDDLPFC